MTLFAEPARETPAWMLAHHPLSTPDALVPLRDPAELALVEERAKKWSAAAQQNRDETMRTFRLEDRADNGLVLRRWGLYMTPAAAWWWVTTTTAPAGHHIVLIDPATHRRLP